MAWLGLALVGLAWPGLAWLGLAWPGLAWLGLAWLGLAGARPRKEKYHLGPDPGRNTNILEIRPRWLEAVANRIQQEPIWPLNNSIGDVTANI